jgi:hypothetical protein
VKLKSINVGSGVKKKGIKGVQTTPLEPQTLLAFEKQTDEIVLVNADTRRKSSGECQHGKQIASAAQCF